MDIKSKFSHEVVCARKRKGFTQEQVAEATSMSVRWLQKIEKGKSLPGSELLLRLMLLLEIDIELFREEAGLLPFTHR